MNREEFFYLFPYFISLAITLGVFLYSWKHRRVRGAETYLWFVGGQSLTIFAFIFELISPNLETKLMWDKLQWLTDSFLVILPFLIFAVRFSGKKFQHPRITWGFWLFFPLALSLLLLTDSLHHLIYPNPHLSAAYPFPELLYDLTIVVYIYAIFYVYGANFYGISLLIRRALQTNRVYRLQYLTVAFGFLIPVILSLFALAGIQITLQRDLAPFSFAMGNLIVAWGLFRYGLFDITPIARERIVENLNNAVIVLDTTNRIVDINSAALNMIEEEYQEVVGRLPSEILDDWPDLLEMLEKPHEQRREISVKTQDDTLFYDISVSPMINNNRELIGHIIVAHDITRTKALEVSYRILSSELDQRVKERTGELRESEERYRALFEDSPIPLLEEDFSVVKQRIDELERSGVRGFQAYFKEHPQVAKEFLESVYIVDVNKAAMKWYAVESKKALQVSVGQLMHPEYLADFISELLALIANRSHFEVNVERKDRNGNPLYLIVNGNISPGHEDSWSRVMVSILDITKLKQAEADLAVAYDTTLEGWAKALELRDKETEGHSRRVMEATLIIARAMGVKEDELMNVRRGSILHDIGKMAIPDEILRKDGPLTEEEREIVNLHPQVAYDLLSRIPYLEKALEIPYCHHEKWDGSGYPRGLKGNEIPFTARIFAVADVWDALSSDRTYRNAWDKEKVTQYLQDESGKHFDPKIVEMFIELLKRGEI